MVQSQWGKCDIHKPPQQTLSPPHTHFTHTDYILLYLCPRQGCFVFFPLRSVLHAGLFVLSPPPLFYLCHAIVPFYSRYCKKKKKAFAASPMIRREKTTLSPHLYTPPPGRRCCNRRICARARSRRLSLQQRYVLGGFV